MESAQGMASCSDNGYQQAALNSNSTAALQTPQPELQSTTENKGPEFGKQMEDNLTLNPNTNNVTNDPKAISQQFQLNKDKETEIHLLQAVLEQQPLHSTTNVITTNLLLSNNSLKEGNGALNGIQNTAESPLKSLLLTIPTIDMDTNTEIGKEANNEDEYTELSPKIATQQDQQQIDILEKKLEQLQTALTQKENMITLFQRENAILEKEKQAFRKEKELATKEKEATVIKFAMKEKLLIDAKKEKEQVEKQLADAKKEIKNITMRFQAVNEEKSRITYIIDEKCNEVRKYQRDCEKLKADNNHLESKLKYHMNKLNMEIEAKAAIEKKLEEERNAPNRIEEKALENLKMEHEANTILLRHEISHKTEQFEALTKENKKSLELIQELREQLSAAIEEKTELFNDFESLRSEHDIIQSALSNEMLNSAKLRGQLDDLQVLRTQNALNEDKIKTLNGKIKNLEETIEYNAQDLQELHTKEVDLLCINKEISESIVNLQNEICLLKAKLQGIEAENSILKKESNEFDTKYEGMEKQLKKEIDQRNEERLLLTKHLSEKTKLHETTKQKLETVVGDFEATNHKHQTIVKELQREIQKYKKFAEQQPNSLNEISIKNSEGKIQCISCQRQMNGYHSNISSEAEDTINHSRSVSRSSSCKCLSESQSEAETTVASNSKLTGHKKLTDGVKEPSKKHLVERILRLQQASARQTEKIDFLENHTLSLVAELQKKSKVVQYYMLRDQAGALTSSKSDQHKSELSKYGNGVMSAIYGGIKAENKSMNLELSLEINKKLQAVLEDTLLKNITLKENLDVLGLEVDNLTRKLRHLEKKE